MRLADICGAQRTLEEARTKPIATKELLTRMWRYELDLVRFLDEKNENGGRPKDRFSIMVEVEEENVEGQFGIVIGLRYADGEKRVFDLQAMGEVPALVTGYRFTLTDPEDRDIEDDFGFDAYSDD